MAISIITDKLRESRHNTNIGGINITSLNIGRKRPIFCREVKPGDKGTLSISGNYILNPLVATNVGKVHVKTEAYFVPACDNMVGFEDMLLGKPVYKNGVAVNPHVPRVNVYNWVNQFFLNCNYNTSLRCYTGTLDDSFSIITPSSLVNVDVQEQLNALGTRDFDKNSSTYFKNDSYCSINPTNEIIAYIPFNIATRLMRGEITYEEVLSKYKSCYFVPYWNFIGSDEPLLHFCSLAELESLNVPYSTVYDFVSLHMSGRHGEEFMLLDDFQQHSYMMTTDDNILDSFYVPLVRLTQYGKDVLNLTNAFKWVQTYNPMYLFNSTDSIHSFYVTSYGSGSSLLNPQTKEASVAGTCCLFSDVFGHIVRLALLDSSTRTWMLNNLCKRSKLYAQGFDYFIDEQVPTALANICVNNSTVYFLDINAFVDNICSADPLGNSSLAPLSDPRLLFNLPNTAYTNFSVYTYNFEGLCGKYLFDFTYVVSLLPIAAHCSLFYTHTLPKVWKNLFYRLYSMLSHDGTYEDSVYLHLLQVLLPLSFVTRYDDNFLSEVWATPTSPDGEVVGTMFQSSNGVLSSSQSANGISTDFPAYGINNSVSSDNSRFREQLVESVSNFLGVGNLTSAAFDLSDPLGSQPQPLGDSYLSAALDSQNNPLPYSSLLALKLARHLRSFALKNNVNSFSKIAALCERFGMKYETHDLFESSLIYSNETEIEVQKIASTTETNQISLGDIAGHGESYDNGKKVSFRADRFGYVIVYLSVTPVGVLYEGRNKEMSHIDMLDFYSPQTDALTMTPVSSSEVRARYDDSYMPVKLGSSVFGFAPYGYEYKIGNNVLSGDFLIRSAGKYTQDSYHLLRTLGAGSSFNGNGSFSPTGNNPFNYSYLVQNPFFNLSFDAQQFNRIFQSTDSLLDKIYFFGRVDFNLSRQGRPLFDLSLDENATESIN